MQERRVQVKLGNPLRQSNVLSHSLVQTTSVRFTVIYHSPWAGLIKQPHWCSDDAFPGLNLLEAANWLSNCRKIMSRFPLGMIIWLTGRLGRAGIAEGPVHSRTTGDLTLKLCKLASCHLGILTPSATWICKLILPDSKLLLLWKMWLQNFTAFCSLQTWLFLF